MKEDWSILHSMTSAAWIPKVRVKACTSRSVSPTSALMATLLQCSREEKEQQQYRLKSEDGGDADSIASTFLRQNFNFNLQGIQNPSMLFPFVKIPFTLEGGGGYAYRRLTKDDFA